MILSLDDWKSYPSAIVDLNTRNESWIRMASLLKLMGVKNYYFFLALLQPELQGVDPYSPDLTDHQKTLISYEVRYNIWYFFREVVRVPNGNNPLRYGLNRGNLSLYWSFLSGIDYGLIMIRQTGKTLACDALENWLLYIYYRNQDMFLFTKDDKLRKKNISRLKDLRDLLPVYLIPTSKKDVDNLDELSCSQNAVYYRTKAGQPGRQAAESAGRGLTAPYVRIDEGPYIPNAQLSIPAIISITGAARENAENDGTLYGNVYITSAGRLDSTEGKYMYNFLNSGMYWNETLYDCKDKYEARETVITNSGGRCLLYGTFNHRQLSKTDEWLKKRIMLAQDTADGINKDYFNIWVNGSEYGAIPSNLLDIIRKSEIDPLYTEVTTDRYIISWYTDKNNLNDYLNNNDHIISLDSSQAVGRDSNGLVFTNVIDMGVTAVSRVNEASLLRYGEWIATLLIKYPRTTFVIEAKDSARGLIDTIIARLVAAGIDPFKRMYSSIVDNHKDKETEFREISQDLYRRPEHVYIKYKKYIGFNTTGKTRRLLYDTILNDAIRSTGHLIKDKCLSDELRGLIIKKGKVDHMDGAHDDLVIAWLLAHWFIKHTKNLSYYGINTMKCLSGVVTDGASISKEEVEKRKQITVLNDEINSLKQELLVSNGIIDNMRLEKMLAYKVGQANALGDSTLNLDTIMRSIDENKTNKTSLRTQLNNLQNQNLYRRRY